MRVLVTGSAGHLGEALMRTLPTMGFDVRGLDLLWSPFTQHLGSITDRDAVAQAMADVDVVVHTATLHKPHVVTHAKQEFVDCNITGTLVLLEEAVAAGAFGFVFTSTTSAFGRALRPAPGAPAAWIDEQVHDVPKNIYGATKTAAEDLCALFARDHGLNAVVLRTSRFFPEEDDSQAIRLQYSDSNAKANEFLYRRLDMEDAAVAHARAIQRIHSIGFGRYILSAATPFRRADLPALRSDPGRVVESYFPDFPGVYAKAGFRMFPEIDRVYDSSSAQRDLAWRPRYDFGEILRQIAADQPIGSALSRDVGAKGYHSQEFSDGPYPVDHV